MCLVSYRWFVSHTLPTSQRKQTERISGRALSPPTDTVDYFILRMIYLVRIQLPVPKSQLVLTKAGDLVDVAYWSVIETNVTVLCACVVAIKPALKYLFPEKLLSSTRSGWSRFLSSRSAKSTGSGSTGSGSKEKSSEYSSGSFERLQDRPPHLPLYNESADRFGSKKLDDGQHVPLSAIFVERSDSWAKGAS